MDLHITLTTRGKLGDDIYRQVRAQIVDGRLPAGTRLPSSRELADRLEVSRNIVIAAFDRLIAEGFAESRVGSGTYVAEVASRIARRAPTGQVLAPRAIWRHAIETDRRPPASVPYDLRVGAPDPTLFPWDVWRSLVARQLRGRRRRASSDPAGAPALRAAIARHIGASRSVVAGADDVVVTSGAQQALDLIARVLIERGDRVAIEDPGYQGTREVLRAVGARLLPVAVDRDGLDPARLPAAARIAFVTPSHQFPTGAILPLLRRMGLLDWARRSGAVVVEDDYDGEFHYEGQPLESLQGLDREGRVIYIGTFSRTVFSALRIGYLVAPRTLLPAFTAAKWLCDRHTATLEQETLAEFLASGLYERYLRRVRRRNTARRQALLDAIGKHLGGRVEVTGAGAGAHVVLWPIGRAREEAIIASAAARGVGVYGIAPYYLKQPARPGMLLGYSRMRESEIREGIRRLAEAF